MLRALDERPRPPLAAGKAAAFRPGQFSRAFRGFCGVPRAGLADKGTDGSANDG